MLKGFPLWVEGLTFIVMFFFVIGFACFWVALLGSRMINDIGNHPTKSAQLQFTTAWKLMLIELVAFALLVAFYMIFN